RAVEHRNRPPVVPHRGDGEGARQLGAGEAGCTQPRSGRAHRLPCGAHPSRGLRPGRNPAGDPPERWPASQPTGECQTSAERSYMRMHINSGILGARHTKEHSMEIGVFSVSDITTDPTTGHTPSENERIKAEIAIAKKVEEIGMDVFAIGEHHNRPFFSSSPTTTLAYIAAQTEHITLLTATTLITTNDPVKIAEDFAMLQHVSGGRADLVLGRGNTAPVYPWFGKNPQDSVELTIENYNLLR